MEPRPFEIKAAEAYDSFCKKIIKYTAVDCHNAKDRIEKNEAAFSELSTHEQAELATDDRYFAEPHEFIVLGRTVIVHSKCLAGALMSLPKQYSDIVMCSYFLNMADREIAIALNMKRRTVAYQRAWSIQHIKNYMVTETVNDERK